MRSQLDAATVQATGVILETRRFSFGCSALGLWGFGEHFASSSRVPTSDEEDYLNYIHCTHIYIYIYVYVYIYRHTFVNMNIYILKILYEVVP